MATGLVKRVMLSYSRESKDIVSVVYEMLQKEEIGVWFDEQDVDDTWDERMMKAVENSHTVCCFLTGEYQASPYCQLELQYAKKLNKRIIPCVTAGKNQWKLRKGKWLDLIIRLIVPVDFSDSSEHIVRRKTQELISRIKNGLTYSEDNLPELTDKLLISIKQKYLQKSQIKVICNDTIGFPIEKAYINLAMVAIRDEEEIWSKKLIKAEDIFKECRRRMKRVLLLGRAGIGKSVFCDYATYRWVKGDLWSQYDLVVLIRLHELTKEHYPGDDKYMPVDLIINEYFPGDRLSYEQRQALQDFCENHNVLWILDGYDKFIHLAPENVKYAINEIFNKENCVLTSRPCAINLSYEIKIEIMGFVDDNIENYITHYFKQCSDEKNSPNDGVSKLLNFVKSNPSIWTMVHTPINLELLCGLWLQNDWSNTKKLTSTTLYESFINLLCQQNDHCERELFFLERLAFSAMESSSYILKRELVAAIAEDSKYNLSSNPKLLSLGVLKLYGYNTDKINLKYSNSCYFNHFVFQEYFAARYLARQLSTDEQLMIRFINSFKYDRRFTMVFVFTASILASRAYFKLLHLFMNTIESAPRDLIGIYHIKLIIQLFDELASCENYHDLGRHLQDICNWFQFAMKQANKVIQASIIDSVKNSTTLSNLAYFKDIQTSMQVRSNTDHVHTKNEDSDEDTILTLTNLFRNSDKNVRNIARHILIKISGKARADDLINALLSALRDSEWFVRKMACSTIKGIGDKVITGDTMDALIETLSDPEERVQYVACQTLVKIVKKVGNSDTISVLTQLLQGKQLGIRKATCTVLAAMGEEAAMTDTINAFVLLLKSEKATLRAAAREALASIGQNTMDHYLISEVIQIMHDPQHEAREAACQVITKLGRKAAKPDVINSLTQALTDEEWSVRKAACNSLKAMGDRAVSTEVIVELIEILEDEKACVRYAAVDTLTNMPPAKIATRNNIDTLIRVLSHNRDHDKTSGVSQLLVRMFMQVMKNYEDEIVLDALRHSNYEVTHAACEALQHAVGNVATREIVIALTEILERSRARSSAVWEALARMYQVATPTDMQATYYQARRDPEFSLIIHALEVLLKCYDQATSSYHIAHVLNQALIYDNDGLRQTACQLITHERVYKTHPYTANLLVKILKDSHYRLKVSACEALQAIGCQNAKDEVIDAIVDALKDSDPHLRSVACETISKMGEQAATKKTIDALSRTLRDPESWVKKSASRALTTIALKTTMKEIIDALLKALKDSDPQVRRVACEAFISMNKKIVRQDVIDAFLRASQDSDLKVRIYAIQTFVLIDEETVQKKIIDSLVKALQDSNPEVRKTACHMFKDMNEKAATKGVIDALTRALHDSDACVISNSCEALAAMGVKAVTKDFLHILSNLLRHKEWCVKNVAFETLVKMVDQAITNEAIDILVGALQDQDASVKWDACEALAKLGEKAATADAISGLSKALRDSDSSVRDAALKTLVVMGERSVVKESIDAMHYVFSQREWKLTENVLKLLTAMGKKVLTKTIIDVLIENLRHAGMYGMRYDARKTLVELAEKKALDDFIDVFIQIMQDPDVFIKVTSCKILAKTDQKLSEVNTINAVIELSKDPEIEVRSSACDLLASMMGKDMKNEVFNRLFDLLQDPESNVRHNASKAFRKLSENEARDYIISKITQALKTSEKTMQLTACEALKAISENVAVKDIMDVLIQALKDPEVSVRKAACEVLGQMDRWWVQDAALEAVIQTLHDLDPSVRAVACRMLARIKESVVNKDTIDTFVDILRDEKANAQEHACSVLQKMGSEAARKYVVYAVIDFARKLCWYVPYTVRETFLTLWQYMETEDSIDVLLNVLQDPNDKLKCIACEALKTAEVRSVTKEIIALLIKMLLQQKSDSRKAALEALLSLDEKVITKYMVNELFDILHNPEDEIKCSARDIICGIYKKTKNQDVIDTIFRTLQQSDEDVRKLVYDAICWTHHQAASSETIDTMIDIFRDSDENFRRIMRKIFLRMEICPTTRDVMNSLIQTLQDPDDDIRELAFQVLLTMNETTVTRDVVNLLIETMQHADWLVRHDIAEIFYRWKFLKLDSDQINQLLSPSEQINGAAVQVILMSDNIPRDISERFIDELTNAVFFKSFFRYENISTARLLQIWLDDSRNEWIPLLVHCALAQNTAIVRMGEDLVIYRAQEEMMRQPVDEEKFLCFSAAVCQCLMKMNLSTAAN